jgi:hypothetical protein
MLINANQMLILLLEIKIPVKKILVVPQILNGHSTQYSYTIILVQQGKLPTVLYCTHLTQEHKINKHYP